MHSERHRRKRPTFKRRSTNWNDIVGRFCRNEGLGLVELVMQKASTKNWTLCNAKLKDKRDRANKSRRKSKILSSNFKNLNKISIDKPSPFDFERRGLKNRLRMLEEERNARIQIDHKITAFEKQRADLTSSLNQSRNETHQRQCVVNDLKVLFDGSIERSIRFLAKS